MKKLLGIVVLSLLWCNSGYSENIKLISCTVQDSSAKNILNFDLNIKTKELAQFDDEGTYRTLKVNYNSSNNSYSTNLEPLPKGKEKYKWIVYPDKNSVKFEFYNKKEKFMHDAYWICAKNIRIAEKPKEKKKPENKTPDDNKVVPAGSGSGFFVSRDGHIITNHHVIEGCKTTKVSFNGDQIEAKILAVDKVNDIAILKTDINPNRIFSVSNEDVSLLEDVIVAGFPLGKKVSAAIKTHKGVVTALAGAGDNYSEFQTDATINQGNSGGPVINQKGNVVGIAVALLDVSAGQNMFFAIKSSTLKQFGSSNSLTFIQPNNKELNNKDLGKLITEATVYLECYMSIAKIKQMIALENNKKAFFSEFK